MGKKILAIPFDNTPSNPDSQKVIADKILTAVAKITKAQEVDIVTHLKDFCHSEAFETGLTTLNTLNDRPIYDHF